MIRLLLLRISPVVLLIYFILFCQYIPINSKISYKSPYYQYLQDCNDSSKPFISKKTKLKGIVCPMVKDEQGFLSEWVAYYEMHGINHIIIYDNNSTLSLDELSPWISSKFVTIKSTWSNHINVTIIDEESFYNSMKPLDFLNHLAGIDCKLEAIQMGIDIYLAVDIDEYVIPTNPDETLMDDLVSWFNYTKKGMVILEKKNFSPTPHFHEPIHLLTIEAYQTRYPRISKMTYYISTARKVGFKLFDEKWTKDTSVAMIYCCHIHGCDFNKFENATFMLNNINCEKYQPEWKLIWKNHNTNNNERNKISWKQPPYINHYARSLEKFALKQDTWESLSSGNSSLGNGQGLSMYNFMNRAYGFEFDDSALVWSCLLRIHLRNRTGVEYYLRPGDMWIRNVEYGKIVNDPRKRGRNGNGKNIKLKRNEYNPYPPQFTYQVGRRIHA